jgi:hypothetical protein
LASYKRPKDARVVALVPRSPSGKPDYPGARQLYG